MILKNKNAEIKYLKYKQAGLCTRCGEPARENRTTCEKCAKYYRIRRNIIIDMKVCPACGKNELFGDEKICLDCRTKNAEYQANARKKGVWYTLPEYKNKEHRQRYEKYKKMGLCPQCGKRKPALGKVRCSVCLAKNAEAQRQRTNKKSSLKWEDVGA